MGLWAKRSDPAGERRGHVAAPALAAAPPLVGAAFAAHAQTLLLLALTVACMGVYATLGPFWGLGTTVARGRASAGGIALINSIGCLGGYAGPFLFQRLNKLHLPFDAGYLALAAS